MTNLQDKIKEEKIDHNTRLIKQHRNALLNTHIYVGDFIAEIFKIIDIELIKTEDRTLKTLNSFLFPLRQQIHSILVECIKDDPHRTIMLIEKFHNRLHEEGFFL